MLNRRGYAQRATFASAFVLLIAGASGVELELFPGVTYDPDIKIVRAVGTPAITVHYTGVSATRMEVRINGLLAGTKDLDGKPAGEAVFTFDVSRLQPGDNLVEVVLKGASGKVVGTQTTVLSVELAGQAPVYIRFPRSGETVKGVVQIEVGFGVKTRETYVSFFVNKEFRAMKNVAPFTFNWDTSKEQNGWHEIEVWAFDETHTTRKSPAVRVFVQNPGGRTERQPAEPGQPSIAEPGLAAPVGEARGMKAPGGIAEPAGGTVLAAKPLPAPVLALPTINAPVGKPSGHKQVEGVHAKVAGVRLSAPGSAPPVTKAATPDSAPSTTAATSASVPPVAKGSIPKNVAPKRAEPATGRVHVSVGTRVAGDGPFSVFLDGAAVKFDVEPRVANGIPLTPFRHLYEHAGGTVDWFQNDFSVHAYGVGYDVRLKIGDPFALVNGESIRLELAPFIERKRTIVPVSFIESVLNVEVQYDPKTRHVLITQSGRNK